MILLFAIENSIHIVISILYRVWWYLSYGSENKLFYFLFIYFMTCYIFWIYCEAEKSVRNENIAYSKSLSTTYEL